jgi:chemotaxis protein MotA
MKIIIGLLVAIACIAGGFASMGGNLKILFQPFEYVIIVGGAMGAYIISNPVSVLKDTVTSFLPGVKKVSRKKADYLELLSLLYLIVRQVQGQGGLKKLESDIDNPEQSAFFKQFPRLLEDKKIIVFICDYLRLVALGTKSPHEVTELMEEEIETLRHELNATPRAIQIIADAFPALGIIAAIMGIVKTMGHIDAEPAVLGMMIGGALVGTATGIFLCYCVFGPMSTVLQKRRDAEANFYTCVRATLTAYLQNYPSAVCVEYGRKVISTDVRPSFFDVEDATSRVREKGA